MLRAGLLFVVACLLLGRTLPAWGQGDTNKPYTDTLRVLIVFVMFQDDDSVGDPNVDFRDWPLFPDRTTLPAFAKTLLAPTPRPPFADSSLTAYFFEQSLGQLVLFGDVHPYVVVTPHPEARYHQPQGGYGDLTKAVLDSLDAAGYDFTRYDHNGDGILDQLFLVLRRDSWRDTNVVTFGGISCLDARCGGRQVGGGPTAALRYDGITVDWNTSGSILYNRTPGNIIPQTYHVRLMAHEIGHDLWRRFFNHIGAIGENDVPTDCNRARAPTTCIGYALMPGVGGSPDVGGHRIISAFERDLLGWIDCTVLTASQQNVVLGDLYTTSDCVKIPLDTDPNGRVLYLSNHQRLGYFDRYRRGGRAGQFEMGLLRTTGLLVALTHRNRMDVLPADNTLTSSITNADYDGDLYGPTTRTQLTPWTRPNSNGFTQYRRSAATAWLALDRIRDAGRGDGSLAFDFIADFRTQPTIRADSWMGAETHGTRFERAVHITAGSTLVVETDVTFAGYLRVEAGSRVVVAPGATVTLAPGSTLDLPPGSRFEVRGTLHHHAWTTVYRGTRLLQWGGGTVVQYPPKAAGL